MENVIESIRLATQPDADDAVRAEGVRACRAVLAALDATQGAPLAPAPEVSPMQAVVAGLSNMSVEQLLDLAIVRLKAIVPASAPPKPTLPVQPLRIPLLQIPPKGRS